MADQSSQKILALIIAWTIVGAPLLYGVVTTLIEASQLFTG